MAKTLGKFELLKLANAVTDGKKVEVGMVKPFLNHKFEESSRLGIREYSVVPRVGSEVSRLPLQLGI